VNSSIKQLVREFILVVINERKKKKRGLWANIDAKRKRKERPARPGEKGYPETLDIDEDLRGENQ
jgi:hypothetical protein